MKIVNKEDVLNLYKQLLPWEQEEVKAALGVDLSSLSEEEILRRFNIDPIDHVEAKECYETFSDAIINYYYTWELFDEIDERLSNVDPSDIIDSLSRKLLLGGHKNHWFTEDDIDRLEKIISKVKKELNTEEVLGTTVVIREDDGDIQDGTYESWLTLHNTEFDLPTKTNFKEGDKVEIFARKTK